MRRTSIFVLFLIVFIDLLGFGMVIPLLPYYADQYGATATTVGAVVAVYSLMQFFFSPVWGRLSDRVGRRPVLLISLTGSIAGYAIFAIARSIPILFVSRIVAGIAAANIGTAQAYIADTTTRENRAKGMGLIGAAFGLGFILGPPLGGILSHVGIAHGMHGNTLPGIAAASLSATAWTVALFVLGESRKPGAAPRIVRSKIPPQFDRRMWRLVLDRRVLSAVLLTLFLIVISFSSMETTVTLFGKDRFDFTPKDLGYFFGFMGVVVAMIQGGLIGRLTRALGERTVVAIGTFSFMIGFAAVPFVPRPSLLYPAALLVAIGQGLCYPSLMSLVTKSSPSNQHGSVLGVSSSVSSLSRVLGPILGGTMYGIAAAKGAFLVASGIALVAFVIAISIRRLPLNDDPAEL